MTDEGAAFTIDLSGEPDETPVATAGRVIGGLLVLILGVVIMLASLAVFIAGAFVPSIAAWYDWLADGLLIVGVLGFALAATGFAIMRRSRKKRRAAEAAEAEALMTRLRAAGAHDGTATPERIAAAMGEPFDEAAPGIQPVKPPISGPTIT